MNSARPHDPDDTLHDLDLSATTLDGLEPQRATLEKDELMRQLTMQLRTYEGCEKLSVIGITRLDEPDTSGCNWSMSIVLHTAGVEPEVYSLAWADIIVAARATWNLK
jgi:hypothetical protein